MKDHSRSLLVGIILLLVSIVYLVMKSFKVAIFTGILSVVWLGKAIVEWRKNKK